MATKSIYKNVVIKDKRLSKNLLSALENAQNKGSKDVQLSKSYREIKKSQIKELFGEKQ
ncbi:MAG: hypothetical protein U9N81_01515 [Bacillota bacterium]|nr:hypothetical protein [Bacillota bacterium]